MRVSTGATSAQSLTSLLGLAAAAALLLSGCSSGGGSAGAGHTSANPMSRGCAQRANTVAGVTWVHDILIDTGPVDCLGATGVLDSLQTAPGDWSPTGTGALQKDPWTCTGAPPERQQPGVVDWTCTAGDGSKFRSLLMLKSSPSQSTPPALAAPPASTVPASPGAGAPAAGSPGAEYFVDGGYFFISPSGKWRCGILPGKAEAGCMNGTDDIDLPISGVPQGSNSILVDATGPHLANVSPAPFRPSSSTPKVLEYGQTLAVQGFTFTTAESGITCRRDSDGRGFTVSTDGYQFS